MSVVNVKQNKRTKLRSKKIYIFIFIILFMLNRKEIKQAIKDNDWQEFRLTLKGQSTKQKLRMLRQWKRKNKNSKKSLIQTENYINALKRAGRL